MSLIRKIMRKNKKESTDLSKNQSNTYTLKDFDDSFTTLRRVLKGAGVRVMCNDDSPFKKWCWNIYYCFCFANLSLAMVLEIIYMIDSAAKGGSVIPIFRMMPCVGVLILANAKSYKIVLNRPVYKNLIKELRKMWPQGEVNSEEHRAITTALNQLALVVKGYYYSNIALTIIFTTPPFVVIIERAFGMDVPLVLVGLYWMPFDPFQKFVYELIMIWQTWHCIVTIWCMMSGDLMFCVLLSHISMQFDLLAIRIKRLIYIPLDNQLVETYPLGALSKNLKYTRPSDDCHRKNFAEIILRHQALIWLSNDIENEFSFSLLLNFMNGSIIICFCGFCCVFIEKWNVMVYKSFLITALSQIWLLSWFGQRLLDSSHGVSDALYNSGWYKASKKIKASTLIMMHRAQKEVHITTYGFSVISLTSFTSIIKTSWSYFTLLLNVMK